MESSEEYEASIRFHWGAKDDTNFGTNTYATGEEQEIRSSEYYDEAGTYYIGYTVVFGEGSGCEGKSFQRYINQLYIQGLVVKQVVALMKALRVPMFLRG